MRRRADQLGWIGNARALAHSECLRSGLAGDAGLAPWVEPNRPMEGPPLPKGWKDLGSIPLGATKSVSKARATLGGAHQTS